MYMSQNVVQSKLLSLGCAAGMRSCKKEWKNQEGSGAKQVIQEDISEAAGMFIVANRLPITLTQLESWGETVHSSSL